MMFAVTLSAVILVAWLTEEASTKGCSISIQTDLKDSAPLLLKNENGYLHTEAFVYPSDSSGKIIFDEGDVLKLACPNGTILHAGVNTNSVLLEAKCIAGEIFSINRQMVKLSLLTCSQLPVSTARYTGERCAGNYSEIEIGFIINLRFIKHITSCFDSDLQNTLYTMSIISSSIKGSQKSRNENPDFNSGGFYKNVDVSYVYKKTSQQQTINKILKRSSSDTSVIDSSKDWFDRGHLTAKADFIYNAQKNLTFYYANVAPQWHKYNTKNWENLENSCRTLANDKNWNLLVYTGGHGIATLPDIYGRQQQLYLSTTPNKTIPIPTLYYKVVYEPITQAGIAFLTVNVPYKTNAELNKYVICNDICYKINWVNWDYKNITKGYSYCCEVDDMRKSIKVLPKFPVKRVLNIMSASSTLKKKNHVLIFVVICYAALRSLF